MKLTHTLGLASALLAAQTQAHVSMLAPENIAQGQSFKAVVAIPHGCDGSATTAVTIHMPTGIVAVKPQPKAAWRISKTEQTYAQPYDYYGRALTSGVKSLTWHGRLADDEYDEFVFQAYASAIPSGAGKVFFKLEQQCENGKLMWTDVSGKKMTGHSAPELTAPSVPVSRSDVAVHHH